jgi:hypothetical protein
VRGTKAFKRMFESDKNEKDNTSVPELNWRPIIPSMGNHTQPNGNADSRFISVGTPRLARVIMREAHPNELKK